ncbi:MAG: hypothetical protein AAB692_01370 [Patescibacteria group bacterium]
MDPIETRLAAIEAKMNDVKTSVDRMYKFFLWTLIITAVTVVLPLIGLAFAIPKVISTYSSLGAF